MNRSGHEEAKFFVGNEVEHTPAHGMKTLFVIDVQPIDAIESILNNQNSYTDTNKHIRHIFFGANHSFDPQTRYEHEAWEEMITHFLKAGFWCTLDIPINQVEEFNDGGLCEFNNFIPQIRISLPYVKLWNYNTMIKIDDRDFDDTNPGVWCHSLHSLMDRNCFTSWDQYRGDRLL